MVDESNGLAVSPLMLKVKLLVFEIGGEVAIGVGRCGQYDIPPLMVKLLPAKAKLWLGAPPPLHYWARQRCFTANTEGFDRHRYSRFANRCWCGRKGRCCCHSICNWSPFNTRSPVGRGFRRAAQIDAAVARAGRICRLGKGQASSSVIAVIVAGSFDVVTAGG